MKATSIDKGIAWERFFDAVQAESPHVLEDLRLVALRPFKALLLGRPSRDSPARRRKPLEFVIADAETLAYTRWKLLKASPLPAAAKLTRILTDWATRNRMPELDPKNDALFDYALEILLGMCDGRDGRLPWASPPDPYVAALVKGPAPVELQPIRIQAVAPAPKPDESFGAYAKRAFALNRPTFERAWARWRAEPRDGGPIARRYRLFVRHRILGEKLEVIAAEHRVTAPSVRQWFVPVEKALGVRALPNGRPPDRS
ncbi:MAG: hypothetical protein ABI759_10860 [Candidatus Solibacter sp.]